MTIPIAVEKLWPRALICVMTSQESTMPCHLTVVSPESKPLGTRDEVVARLNAALPGLRWAEGPSSFDELASIPNNPLLQLPWSEEQRAVFSLPKLTGTYEADNFGLTIAGLESCPLTSFSITVHGEGNPLPALRGVCLLRGWALVDDAGQPLALDAAAWAAYQQREATRKNVVFGPPERLRVPHDEHRFEYVGRYGGGKQFLADVTRAFPDDDPYPDPTGDWASKKRWYAVLHCFDADGNHLGTDLFSGGTTAEGQDQAVGRADQKLDEMLASLGEYHLCDIAVRPFRVEHEGYLFGLVYQRNSWEDPEDPDGAYECVMLWPNDIMFHPPWDSGEYST
jgi:formate hydrogenlyase regulatory protein HycA